MTSSPLSSSIDGIRGLGQIEARFRPLIGRPEPTAYLWTTLVLFPLRFVSDSSQRRASPAVSALVAVGLLLPSTAARGQSVARVRVEENIRSEPQGTVLGQTLPGAELPVIDRRDEWVQVDVEGWVWVRSLQQTDRDGFDVVVSEPGGENLREAPSGRIIGRLSAGMLLEDLGRSPGWVRVRRRAWVWGPSLDVATDQEAGPLPTTAGDAGWFASVGDQGAGILTAPDGDTLARAVPGADLAVLFREGNWVRVRLEGWTWLPASGAPSDSAASGAHPLSPADLADDPRRHRGRVVVWGLQFVSLERAESVRTDFFEGEPFLLTRYEGPEGAFVYVAVPPDRLQEVQGIIPLERLTVTARIRTGASSLTGTPILDLIQLERIR